MKKLILLSLFIIPLLSGTTGNVYICTGKYAKAYHKTKDCKGIKACKSDVKTISMEAAQKMGRKSCGFCYGK